MPRTATDGGCGWTANFEQLQWASFDDTDVSVAAGPRILNSYNEPATDVRDGYVAAGPRILNSYNGRLSGTLSGSVAAGPRILNSYNNARAASSYDPVAAGPRILNSYNLWNIEETCGTLRLDREF